MKDFRTTKRQINKLVTDKTYCKSFRYMLSNVRIRKHANTGCGMTPLYFSISFQLCAYWVWLSVHPATETWKKMKSYNCIAQIQAHTKKLKSLMYHSFLRNIPTMLRLINWLFKTERKSLMHASFASYKALEVCSFVLDKHIAALPCLLTLTPFHIIVKWIWSFFPHINVLFNWSKISFSH